MLFLNSNIIRSTNTNVFPPPTDGDGEGITGPTLAELEAIRRQKELEAILASQATQTEEEKKEKAMIAAIEEENKYKDFVASMTREYDFEDLQYGDDRGLMYAAHGGRVPAAYGGIMGNDGRRA